jgi:hypothetical protein
MRRLKLAALSVIHEVAFHGNVFLLLRVCERNLQSFRFMEITEQPRTVIVYGYVSACGKRKRLFR